MPQKQANGGLYVSNKRLAASISHYLQRPPVSGTELPHSLFTKRKRELFDFPAEDSGKTVYFCIRYENSKGKSGPWGPIFSAVIP
jgi:hypothetical protein